MTDTPTDTERLDWMERNPHACAVRHPRKWLVTDPDKHRNSHRGATLRDAIDAAIAAEKARSTGDV